MQKARPALWTLTMAICGATCTMPATGQTVQQPVFRSFSTNNTVTVPDQGAALLGGVTTAREGSVSRGVPILGGLPGIAPLFGNRATGREISTRQSYVRAQIIDLREMDEEILRRAAAQQRARGRQPITGTLPPADPLQARAQFLTSHMGRREATREATPPIPRRAEPAPHSRLIALGDAAMKRGEYELATRYYAAAERKLSAAETPSHSSVRQPTSAELDPALVLRGSQRPATR